VDDGLTLIPSSPSERLEIEALSLTLSTAFVIASSSSAPCIHRIEGRRRVHITPAGRRVLQRSPMPGHAMLIAAPMKVKPRKRAILAIWLRD
jgi:hypothetical protein